VKNVCLLWIAVCLLGCGGSAREELAVGRQALADADYAEALDAADSGLAADPDETTQWGLELVKLEALARSGDGAAAAAQLNALAERHPDRIPVTQYSATADQLRVAGRKVEAIAVLDAGVKRFPDESMLIRLIGAGESEGMESAELDLLRKLGYVE
jgi:hypothetical protein